MKTLIPLLIVSALVGCGQSTTAESGAAPPQPNAAATPQVPTKAEAKIITGEDREKIMKPLAKGLEVERDKMEKTTYFSSKGLPRQTSSLDAYIAVRDDNLPSLRMRSIYSGDRWIFYNQVKIMADDVIVYDRQFAHRDVGHHNSGGHVWETGDFRAEAAELAALKAIAQSKSATVRFSGRDKRDDHQVTTRERKDLQQILSAYETMMAQLKGPEA